jgi:putative cell wall-binding protein
MKMRNALLGDLDLVEEISERNRSKLDHSLNNATFSRPTIIMSTQRTIDIRIGAVKRLTKEMKSRRVDVETEKKRTQKLILEGEDQWTVNKQVQSALRLPSNLVERGRCRSRENDP